MKKRGSAGYVCNNLTFLNMLDSRNERGQGRVRGRGRIKGGKWKGSEEWNKRGRGKTR